MLTANTIVINSTFSFISISINLVKTSKIGSNVASATQKREKSSLNAEIGLQFEDGTGMEGERR